MATVAKPPIFIRRRLVVALLAASTGLAHAADTETDGSAASAAIQLEEGKVLGTAAEELKQAPGVSVITAEDIRKSPPANDLSEIIRRMPGVNLTGNSTSGQRGNNRQIDIRGMGPENTLILVDGKPVSSRNSVRMGWRGERDSRGDTNWVPAEQIERIEVLRGPAAARYGSGAAGGVVNIITKAPTEEMHGNATAYMSFPSHKEEGASKRINFSLDGPLTENLSYRFYGNVAKTDMDDADINAGHQSPRTGTNAASLPAGREGVRNRDLNGQLDWRFAEGQKLKLEAGFNRQGNLYTGDTQNTNTNALVQQMLGHETNTLYRQSYALTHEGEFDFGSTMSYLQYERTRNRRLGEGLAGGIEGIFNPNGALGPVGVSTAELKTTTAHSEVSLPWETAMPQVATIGVEWQDQRLDDSSSNSLNFSLPQFGNNTLPGIDATNRGSKTSARLASLFFDDNIELRPGTTLTPGLRFDHHSESGSNWSPALNLSHALTEAWSLKAGIARAYKAPNLYQTNSEYLLYSAGQGCWGGAGSGASAGCYLVGNKNLEAETSVNKELGVEFNEGGVTAGVTYFRNDYRNKIEAGTSPVAYSSTGRRVFQWDNVDKALVEGIEGTLNLPLSESVTWNNNFTYMLQSKNEDTGDRLSIIPKYTLNSMLDWQATEQLSLQATVVYYGKQQPKKYNYQGVAVSGSEAREISPYAIAGLSGTYAFSEKLSVTAGVSNLFDKRLYREGNSQTTGTAPNQIFGAGAYTYNEPGRTFYTSVSTSF